MQEISIHQIVAGDAGGATDPALRASFPLRHRLARAAWSVTAALLFHPSPRPMHRWRNGLLRLFGARLDGLCHIYPTAKIWAPWNLACEELATIADGAEIYNPSPVWLGSHAIVSQGAFLCAASHDYTRPEFPMISAPIRVGPYAWICARAVVQMGVTVGERAILGLGAIATRDLEPWGIYAGLPARKVKERPRFGAGPGQDSSPGSSVRQPQQR